VNALLGLLWDPMVRLLAARNLRSDRFGTLAAILGVALGTATVDVVVVLDVNTVAVEAGNWSTDPTRAAVPDTIGVQGYHDGLAIGAASAKKETHEDYQVMRSAIRLGSLAAFLVGALIVFFTFAVVVDRRRREVGLLRSLGALPRQVGAIFVREAAIVGGVGALLGLVATVPIAYLAAAAGMSTTGRARLPPNGLHYPWRWMLVAALVGWVTALLGVLRPARDMLRLDVGRALAPDAAARTEGAKPTGKTRGVGVLALPFAALVYALMRPFFRDALPSLTFFVIEAGLVCAAFLATLVLVPELVRVLGGAAVRLLPGGPSAARLLTQRRVERMGHELSWSVSGVMLVFALLLSLHVATLALRRELHVWSHEALHEELFVMPEGEGRAAQTARADTIIASLPSPTVIARMTSRTPWPNAVEAAIPEELAAIAEANGRPDLAALARRLGPGKVLLSRMMARRYRVGEGDQLELSGRAGTRRFDVVGVSDGVGFTPVSIPYRNAKTYAVIDAADADVLAPYAAPLGAVAIVAKGDSDAVQRWRAGLGWRAVRGLQLTEASWYRGLRERQSVDDFVIFDLILALTSLLAAIGITNQLVLSVRARRRELALYRVLGMTSAQVRRLVLLEGGFIGLLGGALAATLGVPLGYAAIGALKAVSVFDVEFGLPWHYAAFTVAGSVVISLVASLYPATAAARADAAESVHYE
jgi:putative ABC transport system permease protein